MKIIFPDKKATIEEIEEILKFAMEGRKRVKDQILRIDKTLPPVEFAYIKKSGEKVLVKCLEELQYANLYTKDSAVVQEEETTQDTQIMPTIVDKVVETQPDGAEVADEPQELQEKHFVFEENQTGITYDKLFGPIFKGAKQITIIDPYIRNFFQSSYNYGEFIVSNYNGENYPIKKLHTEFKALLKKVGIEMRFHDLRGTYTDIALKANVPLKQIQRNLGHSRITTTMDIYSELLSSVEDESAIQFEEQLKKEGEKND